MLILVLDDKEEKLKSKEESIFTTNYYTWALPLFIIEATLEGLMEVTFKWKPKAIYGVYQYSIS